LLFQVMARICAVSTCAKNRFTAVTVVVWPLAVSMMAISPGVPGVLRTPATREASWLAEAIDRPISPPLIGRARPELRSSVTTPPRPRAMVAITIAFCEGDQKYRPISPSTLADRRVGPPPSTGWM
jgi:hypothetical protein